MSATRETIENFGFEAITTDFPILTFEPFETPCLEMEPHSLYDVEQQTAKDSLKPFTLDLGSELGTDPAGSLQQDFLDPNLELSYDLQSLIESTVGQDHNNVNSLVRASFPDLLSTETDHNTVSVPEVINLMPVTQPEYPQVGLLL